MRERSATPVRSISWKKCCIPNTDETEAIAFVESLFQRYGVEPHCLKVAQSYADRAKAALAIFPETSARTALAELADYVVSRES